MNIPRILALGGTILGLAALAGCGGQDKAAATPARTPTSSHTLRAAPSGGGQRSIAVKLTEWKVTTSASAIAPGKVTFDITNAGKAPHELIVLRTTKDAADLGHATRIKEAGHVGEQGNLPAGASRTLTLTLKPGHYSLVCNLPGHYMSGMHADFTVA